MDVLWQFCLFIPFPACDRDRDIPDRKLYLMCSCTGQKNRVRSEKYQQWKRFRKVKEGTVPECSRTFRKQPNFRQGIDVSYLLRPAPAAHHLVRRGIDSGISAWKKICARFSRQTDGLKRGCRKKTAESPCLSRVIRMRHFLQKAAAKRVYSEFAAACPGSAPFVSTGRLSPPYNRRRQQLFAAACPQKQFSCTGHWTSAEIICV